MKPKCAILMLAHRVDGISPVHVQDIYSQGSSTLLETSSCAMHYLQAAIDYRKDESHQIQWN